MNQFPSSGVLPSYQGATSDRGEFSTVGRSRPRSRWWSRMGWIVGVTASMVALVGWRWHAESVPVYEGSFQLLLKSAAVPNGVLPILPQSAHRDGATAIALLERPALLQAALSELERPELTPQNWPEGLSLDRVEDTQIVEVRYRHANPEAVLGVLDALARTYLQHDRTARQTQWDQLLTYVETQRRQLQAQKEQQQVQLQEFQTRYAIDPEIQVPQVLERLGALTEERSQTQQQLGQQQTLYTRLLEQLGVDPQLAIPMTALSQSPRYQAIKTQLQEVESEISQELTRFQEGTPPIQVLRDEQKNLAAQLHAEARNILGAELAAVQLPSDGAEPNPVRVALTGQFIEAANQIQVLKVHLESLSREIGEIERQAQLFPGMMQDYANLQQALEQTTQQLEDLTSQQVALQFQAGTQPPSDWEIVAPPEIPRDELDRPVPLPDRRLPIPVAIAGLLGLGLGLGIAIALERLDTRLRDPQEVAELTGLPVLALVPKTNFRRSQRGSYAFQASLRALWSRLSARSDRPFKSLVVLSPESGGGTSTIARHFALAVAAAGMRVLLVDGNLRRATGNRRHRASTRPGLSDAIVTDLNFNSSIARSPWNDNVFVLSAGSPHTDPDLLLASTKMKQVAAQLRQSFDLVIYDAPALRQYPDGQLLAALTDGVAIVLKLDRSRRSPAMHALAQLQAGGIPVLGTIVNGADEMDAIAYSCVRQPDRHLEDWVLEEANSIESQQR